MSIIFCGKFNCDHAGFPHRLVIIEASVRTVRDPHSRKVTQVPCPRQEFVICATCDHWVRSPVKSCSCPHKCHELEVLRLPASRAA